METELKIDLLKVLAKHNIIPDNYVRNEEIRRDYKILKSGGMTGKEARQSLAEKNFCSIKNIEAILYGHKAN